MKGIIDSISRLGSDDFGMLFVGFPATALIVLGIVGGIEAGIVGLHAWSIATFATIIYYLIGGATALSINIVARASKVKNHFIQNFEIYFASLGFILTLLTLLIALWQVHWMLGGITTTVLGILTTGIVVAVKIKKEESV